MLLGIYLVDYFWFLQDTLCCSLITVYESSLPKMGTQGVSNALAVQRMFFLSISVKFYVIAMLLDRCIHFLLDIVTSVCKYFPYSVIDWLLIWLIDYVDESTNLFITLSGFDSTVRRPSQSTRQRPFVCEIYFITFITNKSGIHFAKKRYRLHLILFKCITNISTKFIE